MWQRKIKEIRLSWRVLVHVVPRCFSKILSKPSFLYLFSVPPCPVDPVLLSKQWTNPKTKRRKTWRLLRPPSLLSLSSILLLLFPSNGHSFSDMARNNNSFTAKSSLPQITNPHLPAAQPFQETTPPQRPNSKKTRLRNGEERRRNSLFWTLESTSADRVGTSTTSPRVTHRTRSLLGFSLISCLKTGDVQLVEQLRVSSRVKWLRSLVLLRINNMDLVVINLPLVRRQLSSSGVSSSSSCFSWVAISSNNCSCLLLLLLLC